MKPLRMDDVLPLVEMDYLEQTEVRMDRIYYFSKKLKVSIVSLFNNIFFTLNDFVNFLGTTVCCFKTVCQI